MLPSRKKTLLASFRQGRSTITSFTYINAPILVKGQRIDRIVQHCGRGFRMHGWLDAATRPYYVNSSSYTVDAFRVQVENDLEKCFLSAFFAGFNPV